MARERGAVRDGECAGRSGRRRPGRLFAIATSIGLASLGSARAQSLDAAQQAAFEQSFVLRSDRARQDGAEARLRGSLDSFMPTVALLGSKPLDSRIRYNPEIPASSALPDTTQRYQANQYGISLELPLFDGLQRWNNLQSARLQAEAGRNLSVDARQQLLLDTASAYLGVIRDRKIAGFRRAQLAGLLALQRGVENQFALNDATRTDTALASSRVADARSAIDQAVLELSASELEFERLTRRPADRLGAIRLPPLPRSEAELAERVRGHNPKLAASRLDARSAGYLAESAKGALLPQVSLQVYHSRFTDVTPTLRSITDTTTAIQARIPIYEPGSIPRIAEASALARQKRFETDEAALQAVTAARVAFGRRAGLQAQTASLAVRVTALRGAVRGYEIERGAGFRTVVDELNARAELAQAEILLATGEAERDRLAFVLAALMGALETPEPGPAIAVRAPPRFEPQTTGSLAVPPRRNATAAAAAVPARKVRALAKAVPDGLRLRLGSAAPAGPGRGG